jgi:tetratricopeptide (TPR) repeat protein
VYPDSRVGGSGIQFKSRHEAWMTPILFRSGSSSARTFRVLCVGLIAGLIAATGGLPTARCGDDRPIPAAEAAGRITAEEAQQFANELSEAVNQGDFNTFNRLLDWETVLATATMIPNLPELQKSRDSFKAGVRQGIRNSGGGLAAQICEMVKKGGAYGLIRMDVTAKEPFVLFRLVLTGDSGLNYHRFYLARTAGNRIVARDLYFLLTAERISETLHRAWLTAAAAELKADSGKPDQKTAAFLDHLEEYQLFVRLLQAGKNAEALEKYYEFPEEMRHDKNLLFMRYKAALAVSTEEHLKCLDDFQKYYSQDEAVSFLMIDGYFHREQFADALKSLDRVIAAIGRDGALLSRRANVLLAMKKVEEAQAAIKEAIDVEPEYRYTYSIALDVALAAKDFDATAGLLNLLSDNFGYQWKDLEKAAPFADFVKSPQYRKWLETRKK